MTFLPGRDAAVLGNVDPRLCLPEGLGVPFVISGTTRLIFAGGGAAISLTSCLGPCFLAAPNNNITISTVLPSIVRTLCFQNKHRLHMHAMCCNQRLHAMY